MVLQAELGQPLAGAGVYGEYHGQALAHSQQHLHRELQARLVVHVRGPVQRDHGVLTRGEAQVGHGRARQRAGKVGLQRVDHGVAHKVYSFGGMPSATRLTSASREVVKSRSLSWSVTRRLSSSGMVRSRLRRPASTWATGMLQLRGHQRGGHGGVHIAHGDHQVGGLSRGSPAPGRSSPERSARRGCRNLPPGRSRGGGRPRSSKNTRHIFSS